MSRSYTDSHTRIDMKGLRAGTSTGIYILSLMSDEGVLLGNRKVIVGK